MSTSTDPRTARRTVQVTVLGYNGKRLHSRLIRWQTRGLESHVAIMMHGWVYEAIGGKGVIKRSWDPELDGLGKTTMVRTMLITPAQASIMVGFLEDQVGKPYDWTMVARFVSRRQETRRSRGQWFCSELVAAAFQKIGAPLFLETEPWEVSPGMIRRSLAWVMDEIQTLTGLPDMGKVIDKFRETH